MKRIGNRTLIFENTPVIKGYASVAGKKEYEGPLGKFFDRIIFDPYNGMETFEDAESSFQAEAVSLAIEKSGVTTDEIDYIFAGDLLNQCTGSSFGIRDFQLPFLGQYGACSTMGQGLIMSAVFTDSGAARNAVCATSSHFCAAERQYRFPLEYGSVRTPTAQWTVTGAGSCVVGRADSGVSIAAATVGKITDYQVTDPNNMGAAMAPAVGIIEPQGSCYIKKFFEGRNAVEKLQELIREVTEITYGRDGARLREQLYAADRVRYHILLSEGSLYEQIHQAARKEMKP